MATFGQPSGRAVSGGSPASESSQLSSQVCMLARRHLASTNAERMDDTGGRCCTLWGPQMPHAIQNGRHHRWLVPVQLYYVYRDTVSPKYLLLVPPLHCQHVLTAAANHQSVSALCTPECVNVQCSQPHSCLARCGRLHLTPPDAPRSRRQAQGFGGCRLSSCLASWSTWRQGQ
jgi:hypothetical protein